MNLILDNAMVYAWVGFWHIVIVLLLTRHAVLTAIDPSHGDAGCPDRRVVKEILVFGGASAFTFGGLYYTLALLTSGKVSNFFEIYGTMQLILSIVQVCTYLGQVPKSYRTIVRLKSHLGGCGYTTAWSMFWPLFWLSKIPFIGVAFLWLRNGLTIVDYIFSLPWMIVINLMTKFLFGKWTLPIITRVDHPHA